MAFTNCFFMSGGNPQARSGQLDVNRGTTGERKPADDGRVV